MHVERLKVLQAHLFSLSRTPIAKRPRAFNMNTWFSRKRADANAFCGTAACALGEAGLIPALREQGLKLDRRTGDIKFTDSRFGGTGLKNEGAAAAFFDISRDMVAELFHPWTYPGVELTGCESYAVTERRSRKITPAAVAKRIGRMIEAYQGVHGKAAA